MYPKVSVWAGDESGAISIRVYLANFGEHFSKWKEVSFQDDRFRWCLEPLSDGEKETFSPCETEGTRVGQSATLKALDGSALSQGDREEQIRSLQLFLSFCQGGWVSPFLVEGTDKNGTTCFQQWQDTLLSTFREHGRGWLDRSIIQQLSLVWPGFIAIRKNPIWAESVRLCLYWFLRGDTENVGPDGALILLQAAFERLAWHVLVIDEQKLTEKQFKNSRENPAHKKLRMLLEGMGIPTGIPETLKSLVEYAKLHGAANGPETLTRIRNSLVHPQESESKAKVPVAEGYFLARHYLQLCLLNKFGHYGKLPTLDRPSYMGGNNRTGALV